MKISDIERVQSKLAYREEIRRRIHAVGGSLVRRYHIANPDADADTDSSILAPDIRKDTSLDDEAAAFRKIQTALLELFQGRLDRVEAELGELGVTIDK